MTACPRIGRHVHDLGNTNNYNYCWEAFHHQRFWETRIIELGVGMPTFLETRIIMRIIELGVGMPTFLETRIIIAGKYFIILRYRFLLLVL